MDGCKDDVIQSRRISDVWHVRRTTDEPWSDGALTRPSVNDLPLST